MRVGIFVAQFGSASSTRRVMDFAENDIRGHATIPHTMDVAQPVQTSLPRDGDEVALAVDMLDGRGRDMFLPWDSKHWAKASEM